jgi:uncharacterized protein
MPKQAINIQGPSGVLEALFYIPANPDYNRIAIMCHPHPLQEGTMHNKVVTITAKAFNTLLIPCVTFNYRGVGNSAGVYGDVHGEVADCLAVVTWVQQHWPQAQLCLAGFSFGAYIAAEVATKVPAVMLISIAPSVERMPYHELAKITCPWLVLQGEDDEVVVPQAVYTWFEQLEANKQLIKFATTGHFFHGKLIDLQNQVELFLQNH